MRRRGKALVLAALACTTMLTTIPMAPAQAAPYCGITWGSMMKSGGTLVDLPIVNARVGRHDCYDRLVVDLGAGHGDVGYFVYYSDGLRQPGSGDLIPTAGGATLTVHVLAPGYDMYGRPSTPWTLNQHVVTPSQFTAGGFRTFRDLVWAGTYEGESTFGLGVRARLPFRVFRYDPPCCGSRLVIDVAHQW